MTYELDFLKVKTKKIMKDLSVFEDYCLGKSKLAPSKFSEINKELSLFTVLKIGRYYLKSASDGKHLIWTGLDNRPHDLGSINNMNITREYPGFSKIRSLALGSHYIAHTEIREIDAYGRDATIVELIDGTIGVGMNFKTAFRNAALKMHLSKKSNQSILSRFWFRDRNNQSIH